MDFMQPATNGPAQKTQGYPVNPWDDHRIHARVILEFIRSEEFRDLDPLSQSLLVNHWQVHQAELDKLQMQQMMIAQALQGGPGQKGSPSKAKAPA